MLKIREYLTMRGWGRMDIDIALMQIIARAIYPYSELKTVRYLKENTALAEIFKIPALCHLLAAEYKSSSTWKGKICGAQKITSKKSAS